MNIETKEYASKGVAGTGLGLGIAGTALALLQGGGGIGGILNGGCVHNPPVNRYEAELQQKISALEADVKLRDANTYTMTEMGKLRDYVDRKFDVINDKIAMQAVHNATCDSMMACLTNQVNALYGLTKLVVPNTSVCPGWGGVTVAPATTTQTTTATAAKAA